MLDPAIAPYLLSVIIICLGILSITVIPAIIKMARCIDELARDDEESQPAYDPLVIHGRTCSRMSSGILKIPADCPKNKHDFIVDLECPDGGVVRVEIPIDSNSREGQRSRVFGPCDPPIGLNLVCPGHYT